MQDRKNIFQVLSMRELKIFYMLNTNVKNKTLCNIFMKLEENNFDIVREIKFMNTVTNLFKKDEKELTSFLYCMYKLFHEKTIFR